MNTPRASRARWTLGVEILTPAFLGGARPREVDEHTPLRPPSLRGQWRHWFRLGMAAVVRPPRPPEGEPVPPADLRVAMESLRRLEGDLFGTVTRGSRLLIKPPRNARVLNFPRPDHRERPGLRYLGYGIFEDKVPGVPCVGSRETIALEIGLYREPADGPLARALAATIWLWANLGGVGARWRRGWGGVQLTDGGGLPWDGPAMGEAAGDLRGLLERLNQGLDAALDAFKALAQSYGAPVPERAAPPDRALRTIRGIDAFRALPATFPDAVDALDFAGRLFQDFRSTLRRNDRGAPPLPDYFEVKDRLQGSKVSSRPVGRAAFGLPLPFYFRSLGGAKTVLHPMELGARRSDLAIDRLPSPLLFRVHRLADKRFVVTLTHLSGAKHADPLAGLELGDGLGGRFLKPDRTLINDFLKFAVDETRRRRPEGR